jgi:voltage-gated potassium channel
MTATAAAPAQVPAEAPTRRVHGNAYNIFILVVTLFSLAIMVLLLLPNISEETRVLLLAYDNAACFIFLADFAYNITGSKPKRQYFIHERGWLDLLGSIPSFGIFQFTALLRLARLSRLARISRIMRGKNRKALVADVLKNRGQYATFITLLAAGLVLSIASLMVLQFESQDPKANITTGGDAIWWGIVTLTTVGYGDQYPVTMGGRLTGAMVMITGVGIIGALASILASLLVPPAETEEDKAAEAAAEAEEAAKATEATLQGSEAIAHELAQLRAEIAELKTAVTARNPDPTG